MGWTVGGADKGMLGKKRIEKGWQSSGRALARLQSLSEEGKCRRSHLLS